MPEPLIDVRRRLQLLERRRHTLWSMVDRCICAARVYQQGNPQTEQRRVEFLAESTIAKAYAQCLTVEIYALRAMVGVSAHDARS